MKEISQRELFERVKKQLKKEGLIVRYCDHKAQFELYRHQYLVTRDGDVIHQRCFDDLVEYGKGIGCLKEDEVVVP